MIRNITANDIPEIVKLGRAMHEESSYSELNYSEETCEILLNTWLEDDRYLMLCDEKDGEIRGFFIGFIMPHLFGDGSDLIASDIIQYVKKDYRGTSIAIRLLKEYEEWAASNNVSRICLAHSCEIKPDKLDGLYTKLGYKQFAKNFRKGK